MLSGVRQFKFTWKHSKAGTCNENCCSVVDFNILRLSLFLPKSKSILGRAAPKEHVFMGKGVCVPQSQNAALHRNAPATQRQPQRWQIKALTTKIKVTKWNITPQPALLGDIKKVCTVFTDRCHHSGCSYSRRVCHSWFVPPSHPHSFSKRFGTGRWTANYFVT